MICRHCLKPIEQITSDLAETWIASCKFNEAHEPIPITKWWDDQLRCTGGWHHHRVGSEWKTFGPHQPHTITGREIWPIYIVPSTGEEVNGDREQGGCTAYADMWPLPHKKTSRLFVK